MSRVSCHKRHAIALQVLLATGQPLDEFGGVGKAALFCLVWAATSTRRFKFLSLGTDGSTFNNSKQLWLNIVEMYFSLMFQSLHTGTLRKYLGAERVRAPNLGVKIALPLYQGFRNDAIRATLTCLASDDPEVVGFAKEQLERNLAIGRAKLAELNWAPITRAMKRLSPIWTGRTRNPDRSNGDPEEMKVMCVQCGFTTVDTTPAFHILTGAYVVRKG
ncbi:hypothetical protein QC762_708585 [Podospora pseudocomata]|uniref:Uncharacterized protein n=1 Tax=Podospora pseudocomata TaxID=2093779 RepID=A0ABR0G495_9PEZI|nr:hypothetical protein QC762_708585 [Podospora pseudocomata]